MEPVQDAPRDRRSFLGQLAATVAAGLGIGLIGGRSAGASTSACAIFCSPTADCATGCGGGSHRFHCTTLCGYDFYDCFNHACSGFCFSPNAC